MPTDEAKRLNRRARERLSGALAPDEEIVAAVLLNYTIGTVGGSSDGSRRQAGTVYSTQYAERRGIDFEDRRLRMDLVSTWCAVTPRRLLFHAQKQMAVRPTPGAFVAEVPMEGTDLRYFDTDGLGLSNRVLHLDFADGKHLLTATMLKASLRRKTYSDEPDLFVEAFGDRATRVDNA